MITTGTLTLGIPKVTALVPRVRAVGAVGGADKADYDEETLLRLAGSVEQFSAHILAKAVVEAAQQRMLPLSTVRAFEESFGKGVQGLVSLPPSRSGGQGREVQVAPRGLFFALCKDVVHSTTRGRRHTRGIAQPQHDLRKICLAQQIT